MAGVIAIACIVLDFKMDYSRLHYTTLYKVKLVKYFFLVITYNSIIKRSEETG